jgi:alkylation response protein AidB-like acyl-CoA dehydrogenase
MGRLCGTEGLTDVQTEIIKTVRSFVDNEILPVATTLEHADEYPTDIVEGMKDLGLFGLTIPEEYGGLGGAGARLDERLRHRQHSLHRRVHAHAAWH